MQSLFGGQKTPDTSAQERLLAQQEAQLAAQEEEEAKRKKAEQASKKAGAARGSSLLSGITLADTSTGLRTTLG